MQDRFGREIRALRLSVTDRCDLRCSYCAPPVATGAPAATSAAEASPPEPCALRAFAAVRAQDLLSPADLEAIVRAGAAVGIRRVRLTGGEPLVRREIVEIVRRVARVPRLERVTMTTNAQRLAALARPLADAGLRSVDVSVDALDPDRFARIRAGGLLERALAGLEAAVACGMDVKVNVVVMRGVNEDDLVPLARLSLARRLHVRFLEYMPSGAWDREGADRDPLVPGDEVFARLARALGPLEAEAHVDGDGPAVYYRAPGAPGTIGLITAVTRPFCDRCNRLRVLVDGRLRPCLFHEETIDLKPALAAGHAALVAAFTRAIDEKPEGGARARAFPLRLTGG